MWLFDARVRTPDGKSPHHTRAARDGLKCAPHLTDVLSAPTLEDDLSVHVNICFSMGGAADKADGADGIAVAVLDNDGP